MDSSKSQKLFLLFVIGLIALQWAGCKDNFQPLVENDKYAYSINGALDLHADTQWVRVVPIGKALIPKNPETNDVTVTLTREKTGETSTLKDSLFAIGNNARVWNYWTTMSLHPNENYTLRADGSEGVSSVKGVTIPSPLSVPVVEYKTEEGTEGIVKGSSDEPLVTADLKFYFRYTNPLGRPTSINTLKVSLLDKISRDTNGDYWFEFDTVDIMYEEIRRYPDDPEGYIIEDKQLIVATGSEDWPDYSALSDQEAVLPGKVSNVENGTGYVAGISSRKVPLASCYDEEGSLAPCQEIRNQ